MKIFPHLQQPLKTNNSSSSSSCSSSSSSCSFNLNRSLLYLRILLFLCLSSTAIICGYGSYYIFRFIGTQQRKNAFHSISDQFTITSLKSISNIKYSLSSISDVIGMTCSDEIIWPYCSLTISSYNNITSPLVLMANGRAIGFAPIILPSQITTYENFVYNLYELEGKNNLGLSNFGKGIYYQKNGTRYHSKNITFGRYNILTPIQLIADLSDNYAAPMFDLHSESSRATALDNVIDCFYKYGRNGNCIAVTDIVHLVQDPIFRPSVLITYPINPVHSPNSIVGFTYFVLNWDTLLSDSLPSYVNGIDIVLTNHHDKIYTFRLSNGNAKYLGEGDYHENEFSYLKKTIHIITYQNSIQYTINIYPSNIFMEQYRMISPVITTIVALSAVIITSIIFFIYDLLMNREAYEKELIFNTKRLFVKFISHEIRTPLNTVHLGNKLFIQELSILYNNLKNKPLNSENEIIINSLIDWIGLAKDIESSSDIAILVLNDLINYDKISIGGLKLEILETNFWLITHKTVNPFMVQARQSGVSLNLDLEITRSLDAMTQMRLDNLTKLCVLGDGIKLSQVIRNLVSNALKFTPKGGNINVTLFWDDTSNTDPTIEPIENINNSSNSNSNNNTHMNINMNMNTMKKSLCNLFKKRSNSKDNYIINEHNLQRCGWFVCIIRDNGYGISAENLKHLFKEGMQFNANKLQGGGGSGLGLWISKGITELHGGTLIGYSDGEGYGSMFTLRIPAYFNSSPFISSNVTTIAQQFHVDDGSKSHLQTSNDVTCGNDDISHLSKILNDSNIKKILVVDDSTTSRKIVCRLLKLVGCEYNEAVDGKECIDHIKDSNLPDLILLDYEMPGMNGPTAVKLLRENGYTIPVIGLTGNLLQEEVDYFIESGANFVVSKPLTISRLNECIVGLAFNQQ